MCFKKSNTIDRLQSQFPGREGRRPRSPGMDLTPEAHVWSSGAPLRGSSWMLPGGGGGEGGGTLDVTMAPSTWHWATGARKDEAGFGLENTPGALPSPLAGRTQHGEARSWARGRRQTRAPSAASSAQEARQCRSHSLRGAGAPDQGRVKWSKFTHDVNKNWPCRAGAA